VSIQENGEISQHVIDEFMKLIVSVNNMIQNFRSIRQPLVESSNSMPLASEQLDKVTMETEKATNQMLDIIEGITDREMESASLADNLLTQQPDMSEEAKSTVNKIKQNAEACQNDSFLLMDALQFQDITSQQINHANTILGEIEEKLQSLMLIMGETFEIREREYRPHDPNATTRDGEKRQHMVDELLKAQQEGLDG